MKTGVQASHHFSNTLFERNYALEGGVFLVQSGSTITCKNCTFLQNFAYKGGIALVMNNAILNLHDSMLLNNSALDSNLHTFDFLADLIIAESSTIAIHNSTIKHNAETKLSVFGLEVVRCSLFCHILKSFFTSTSEKLEEMHISDASFSIELLKSRMQLN